MINKHFSAPRFNSQKSSDKLLAQNEAAGQSGVSRRTFLGSAGAATALAFIAGPDIASAVEVGPVNDQQRRNQAYQVRHQAAVKWSNLMWLKTTLVLGALWFAGFIAAQTAGTVKGIVVDENGKPLPKALVRIAETKPFYGHRVLDFYETDKDGKFLIEHVHWGTYAVMAKKEDSGYADMGAAFYSNLNVPIVMLAPGFPTAQITVPVGPKAGLVDLVSVSDAITRKSILESGSITLRRIDNPSFFIKTSTKSFRPFFVPALTNVSIEITAPGYKPWPAADQAEQGHIRLKPEEVLKLEVKLQAENPKPPSPDHKP